MPRQKSKSKQDIPGPMHYEPESLREIEMHFSKLRFRCQELLMKTVSLSGKLGKERATEFLRHGVGRRIEILNRCIQNIFRIFPPDWEEKLSQEDRVDLEINLHAFLINVYGIVENLSLSLAYENGLVGDHDERKVPINEVNFFNKRFQKLLNPTLRKYLRQKNTSSWYREYAKNYRDALAHRIPPYVPPSTLNPDEAKRFTEIDIEINGLSYASDLSRIDELRTEQDGLGRPNPLFLHSFSENSKPVFLHGQVLNDFMTIEEFVNVVVANFYPDHGFT
jgi:hypothetical protein